MHILYHIQRDVLEKINVLMRLTVPVI